MKRRFPLNLQLFAESSGGGEGNGGDGNQNSPANPQTPPQNAPAIDYAKIQQMLEGTLAAKEDTALKAYFKQQGLSQQEVEQAIAAFKQQKAANQPDVNALQGQITEAQSQMAAAQEAAKQAQIESAATMMAVTLGIDAKTIPYVLKMADLGQVMGQDGKINEETLKTSLNKVLEDIPALKPQASGSSGFVQVGAANNQQQGNEPVTLKGAVSEALKR